MAWKSDHNCVSCHHAAHVVWAFHEAKQAGFAVDEPVLVEMSNWIVESGDGKTSLPRPATAPNALNSKALYFALSANVQGTKLHQTVLADQNADGSWSAWPETRPPIFGGTDRSMTTLALLAILPMAESDPAAKAAVDKGVEWLDTQEIDDDPQALAMRLVLWSRLGREAAPLVKQIKERQRDDGGWGQTDEMASDAWATGQALYALAHAMPSNDPAIQRGRRFLVTTQRDDGSWLMTSRPISPSGAGSSNLVPITGAGSAWAVIGLACSN